MGRRELTGDQRPICVHGLAQADPLEIDLPDGHWTEIVAVDPQNIGCIGIDEDPSTASPMTLACRRGSLLLLGKTGAKVFTYNFA
jgi:hypothetical protein